MLYSDRIKQILKRLKELSKLNYPQYKNYSKGIYTQEYSEELKLINEYNQLVKYEKSIDPSFRHNHIIIAMHLTGATAIQNRINSAVAYGL